MHVPCQLRAKLVVIFVHEIFDFIFQPLYLLLYILDIFLKIQLLQFACAIKYMLLQLHKN